mmetsp:Transcript_769/g.1214  ORF Transcript_769/g.1214 Transcript_769/m.1214 type:complete len:176 (+) Transcript_769:94-621(+)
MSTFKFGFDLEVQNESNDDRSTKNVGKEIERQPKDVTATGDQGQEEEGEEEYAKTKISMPLSVTDIESLLRNMKCPYGINKWNYSDIEIPFVNANTNNVGTGANFNCGLRRIVHTEQPFGTSTCTKRLFCMYNPSESTVKISTSANIICVSIYKWNFNITIIPFIYTIWTLHISQ